MLKGQHMYARLNLGMQTNIHSLLNTSEKSEKKYNVNTRSLLRNTSQSSVVYAKKLLAKGAFSAATNAEVARGKAAGLYIEQKIIRTGKLEDMSIEELEAKMKRIYDENKTLIEGEYTLGKEE
jgi:hypothetical protein